jgi:cytochrome P450
MAVQASRFAAPGPRGGEAARALAGLFADPLRVYARLSGRYGDAVEFPIAPGRSAFLLSRPEHAEHVLAASQDNYVKAFTYRPLRALIGDGLLTSEGERWRRHRRLIQPALSRHRVAGYGDLMAAAARRLAGRWDQLADGSMLDVSTQLGGLALEIVGEALFGADLAGDAAQMSRAVAAGQRVAVLATLLPLRYGPRSAGAIKTVARRLGRSPEGIDGPAGRIIDGRRAAGGGAPTDDLLAALLGGQPADGPRLTNDDVTAEVATFLLAGHETSANALSWALALLSAYPAARERLEEELNTVLGGRDPDPGDADKLPWTRAVAAEAMRLYPPAWTIERDTLADDEVHGVPVKAGSLVAIPPYLEHRHPEHWPDPAGFDPRRFLPGGAGDPARRHRYAFIPFGGGKRACIGAAFAELEITLVLATISRRFRLELAAAGLPRPAAYVTLRPAGGLSMRLHHR